MIEDYLNPKFRDFVEKHKNEDPATLALKMAKVRDFPLKKAVDYIASIQKAKNKTVFWDQKPGLVLPPPLSVEQASSDATASFKAGLLKGKHFIDLTGGAGIDTYHFSKSFLYCKYVERQALLCEINQHNFSELSANIQVICDDGIAYIKECSQTFDCIYLDPARRGENRQKLVLLEDCEPNLVEVQDILLSKAKWVLSKASPMLAWDEALQKLKFLKQIWIVSVQNECKEILFLQEVGFVGEPKITAIDLNRDGEIKATFTFKKSEEHDSSSQFSLPQNYLYEAGAAFLKAGAFKSLGQAFGLQKLHPNSHLYTSADLVPDFPGRAFKIIGIENALAKKIKAYLPQDKANITVRNYPESVEQLRQRLKIKEGGDIYIFATTLIHDNPQLIVCQKLSLE